MNPFHYTAHLAVLAEVTNERLAQEEKWGQQDHDDSLWLVILGEEYGEACQASLKRFETTGNTRSDYPMMSEYHLRLELIQIAAVAIAHIEAIDRRK